MARILDDFILYTYYEEVSQFHPGASWVGGGEYYEAPMGVYVPRRVFERLKDQEVLLEDFISNHRGCFWMLYGRSGTAEERSFFMEKINKGRFLTVLARGIFKLVRTG